MSSALARLLPELPAKFGFSIDCGEKRYLTKASADLFVEAASGGAHGEQHRAGDREHPLLFGLLNLY